MNIAPAVTKHPVGGMRLVGQSFTFTVAANGTGPFTYQWLKNSADIPGATSATYTRGPLVVGDADNYSCRVTGPGGVVTSNAVALAFIAETPGTLDPTFDTGVPIANSGAAVNSVILPASGRLWTAGSYVSRLQDVNNSSQTPANRLTTYTGSPLRFGTDGGVTAGAVNVLLPLVNGQVLAGGTFTAAGSPSTNTKYLARFHANGTFDNSFIAPATTGAGGVTAMVQDPATLKIYVAGTFVDWGGDMARDSLVRLNADGTLDGTFSSAAVAGGLTALALAPDGKLYAGGSFSGVNIGGNTNFNFAYLVRLHPDGTVDTTFPFPIGTLQGPVVALAPLPDGRLIVAGLFTNWGAGPSFAGYTRLVCLDPNGSLNTDFMNALGTAPNGPFRDMDLLPDGRPVLCGGFTSIGGVARTNMAVLELNGAVSTSFVPPAFTNGPPNDIMALPDGRVLAGGFFTEVSGGPGGSGALAGWVVLNANGTRDTTVNTSGTPTIPYPAFGRDVNGGIYVVGVQGSGLRRFTGNFVPDPDFLPVENNISGFNGINHIIGLPSGRVVINKGGTSYQGRPVTGTAILRGYPLPLGFITQPLAQSAELGGSVTFSVTLTGTTPLTLQWLKDGVEIPGETAATLTITGAVRTDSAVYSVRASNFSGGTIPAPASPPGPAPCPPASAVPAMTLTSTVFRTSWNTRSISIPRPTAPAKCRPW